MEEDNKSTPGEVGKAGTCSSPIRSPLRDSQGWISVLKRRPRCQDDLKRCRPGSAPPQGRHSRPIPISKWRSANRLSLTSPRRAITTDKLPGRPSSNGDLEFKELLHIQTVEDYGDSEDGEEYMGDSDDDDDSRDGEEQWLPTRVVQHGKAIGMSG